jgi:SAM-dependent methyltransferase
MPDSGFELLRKHLNFGTLSRFVGRHGWAFPLVALARAFTLAADFCREITFDKRYGVKTSKIVATDDLMFSDREAQGHAVRYRPTPPRMIFGVLKTLKSRFGVDCGDTLFVDYGCGAGRVLVIAAECGFNNITGLELSVPLVELCRQNIETYVEARRRGDKARQDSVNMRVLLQNAAEFIPPRQAGVFYFFVPFDNVVYKRVLANIKRSVQECPRTVFVLDYYSHYNFVSDGFAFCAKSNEVSIYRYP